MIWFQRSEIRYDYDSMNKQQLHDYWDTGSPSFMCTSICARTTIDPMVGIFAS